MKKLFESMYFLLIRTWQIDTAKGALNTLTELIKISSMKSPYIELDSNVTFGETKILTTLGVKWVLDRMNYKSKKNESMIIASFLSRNNKNNRLSTMALKFEPMSITKVNFNTFIKILVKIIEIRKNLFLEQ